MLTRGSATGSERPLSGGGEPRGPHSRFGQQSPASRTGRRGSCVWHVTVFGGARDRRWLILVASPPVSMTPQRGRGGRHVDEARPRGQLNPETHPSGLFLRPPTDPTQSGNHRISPPSPKMAIPDSRATPRHDRPEPRNLDTGDAFRTISFNSKARHLPMFVFRANHHCQDMR